MWLGTGATKVVAKPRRAAARRRRPFRGPEPVRRALYGLHVEQEAGTGQERAQSPNRGAKIACPPNKPRLYSSAPLLSRAWYRAQSLSSASERGELPRSLRRRGRRGRTVRRGRAETERAAGRGNRARRLRAVAAFRMQRLRITAGHVVNTPAAHTLLGLSGQSSPDKEGSPRRTCLSILGLQHRTFLSGGTAARQSAP